MAGLVPAIHAPGTLTIHAPGTLTMAWMPGKMPGMTG
jgi:hypothetical protein